MEEGNLVPRRQARPKGRSPRHCWPIFTSITSSISGQTGGVSTMLGVKSSLCATRIIPSR